MRLEAYFKLHPLAGAVVSVDPAAQARALAAAEEAERIKAEQAARLQAVQTSAAEAEAAGESLSPEEQKTRRLEYLMAQVRLSLLGGPALP